jgi:hypothetical protein
MWAGRRFEPKLRAPESLTGFGGEVSEDSGVEIVCAWLKLQKHPFSVISHGCVLDGNQLGSHESGVFPGKATQHIVVFGGVSATRRDRFGEFDLQSVGEGPGTSNLKGDPISGIELPTGIRVCKIGKQNDAA